MSAPKGNKFAEGNNGGRPPIFESSEELSNKIIEYFDWIEGEYEMKEGTRTTTDKETNTTTTETYEYEVCLRLPEAPTITGLALFLGFASRQSLYDYLKKEEFAYSIKRALLIVENSYEKGLRSNNCTGVIFALKNMKWYDSSKLDVTTDGEKINKTIPVVLEDGRTYDDLIKDLKKEEEE